MPSASPIGTEFPVFQTGGTLTAPRIAMAPDGRYAVAWESATGDGSGYGIRARAFSADGSPLTDEIAVNAATTGDQRRPDVAMDASGNFVVAWESMDGDGHGVFFQRFSVTGARLGSEFRANVIWQNEQYEPSVAMAPDGRFAVAFTAYTSAQDGWDVYARRYGSNGAALEAMEVRVNTNAYWSQSGPRAAANADGCVFAYDSYTPESGTSPYSFAQAYTWDGAKRGSEVRLSSNPYHPWGSIVAVGMDAAGNYVTTFNQAYSWDASGWGFYGQRFDPSGNRRGDTFLINTTTAGNQLGLSVAVAPDGSFVATWQGDSQDGTGTNVYAQRFDANGTRLDGEIRVNSTLGGDQQSSQVAVDAYKNPTFVWSGPNGGGTGIYGQQYAIPIPMTSEVATLRPSSNNETMTVTATVSFVGGSYLWQYHVHNNDFRSTWGVPPDALELYFDTTGVTDVSGAGQVLGDRIRWTGFQIPAEPHENSDAYFSFRTPVRAWVQMAMVAYGLADGYGASSLVLAPGDLTTPVLSFVTAVNYPYFSGTQALGVSNFVTTNELPQRVNTTFGLVSSDPENFRLEVVDRASTAASVDVTLQVFRPPTTGIGPSQPISQSTYSLTHRSTFPQFAGYYRSDFLRLVSDDVDDNASGYLSGDPNNQTIRVQLGDEIRIAYTHAAGQTVTRSLQVGRPASEDDNGDLPSQHDIREVKVRIVVFAAAPGLPAPTRAQVEEDIRVANERFAQANIRLKLVGDIQMNVARPGFLPGNFAVDNAAQEQGLINNYKDGDNDSIDIFYVGGVLHSDGTPIPATTYGRGRVANLNSANWIAIGQGAGGQGRVNEPFVLPHEIMHILLNSPHRQFEDPVSLFDVVENQGNIVTAAKRIGPNRQTRAARVGNDDTITIRAAAENLPK